MADEGIHGGCTCSPAMMAISRASSWHRLSPRGSGKPVATIRTITFDWRIQGDPENCVSGREETRMDRSRVQFQRI